MSYTELLHLGREPFSNSPDPDAFYSAGSHAECLNRLEISVRLKRGLNVVTGPVGVGKSTVCRRLVKSLEHTENLETFFLMDAGCGDEVTFVRQLVELFSGEPWSGTDVQSGIGRLQSIVFEKALEKGHNLVLLIDEGQKLPPASLEILRVLLNFETNTEKLLQIVIFAQPEFRQTVESIPNFRDRVNEMIQIDPLGREESLALVRFRLQLAGGESAQKLFTEGALKELYRASGGRPRQMMRLGHLSLLTMIMGNKSSITADMVRSVVARDHGTKPSSRARKALLWGLPVVLVAAAGVAYWSVPGIHHRVDAVVASFTAQPAQAPKVEGAKPTLASAGTKAVSAGPAEAGTASGLQPVTAEKLAERASVTPEKVSEGSVAQVPASLPQVPDEAPVPKVPSIPSIGTVFLQQPKTLEQVATLFYGTDKAAESLRVVNPNYDPHAGGAVTLPEIEYEPPERYRKNLQLAFAVYDTADEALAGLSAFETLRPRIVPWREEGRVRFYLVARASFGSPERAWTWLGNHKSPAGTRIRPMILPPYEKDQKALYSYPLRPAPVRPAAEDEQKVADSEALPPGAIRMTIERSS